MAVEGFASLDRVAVKQFGHADLQTARGHKSSGKDSLFTMNFSTARLYPHCRHLEQNLGTISSASCRCLPLSQIDLKLCWFTLPKTMSRRSQHAHTSPLAEMTAAVNAE